MDWALLVYSVVWPSRSSESGSVSFICTQGEDEWIGKLERGGPKASKDRGRGKEREWGEGRTVKQRHRTGAFTSTGHLAALTSTHAVGGIAEDLFNTIQGLCIKNSNKQHGNQILLFTQ